MRKGIVWYIILMVFESPIVVLADIFKITLVPVNRVGLNVENAYFYTLL